jgi:transcriptional regulator with XRE-family HTH domain
VQLESIEFSSDELSQLHKSIGQRVASIRRDKQVSQLDLALAIGYKSTSVIAKAEAGTENRHFSVEQLYKISKALEIDMCEFFKTTQTA